MAIRRILKPAALGLVLLASSAFAAATDSDARRAFDRLLTEAGLQMQPRARFIELQPQANGILPYEHAIRHESGDLEVRFIVRPLGRIEIEYNDPHNAAPEPNHLFPLLFESITNRLSVGGETPTSTFPETEALKKFNANWAAATAFDINPEFAGDYRNALLVGIHKNETADAYTVFLYNDHQRAKILINESLSILSFAAEPNRPRASMAAMRTFRLLADAASFAMAWIESLSFSCASERAALALTSQ